MQNYLLTPNVPRNGEIATHGKNVNLALALTHGWHPDEPLLTFPVEEADTVVDPSIHGDCILATDALKVAAEKAAKADKDGNLRVRVPVLTDTGEIDTGWMPLEEFIGKCDVYTELNAPVDAIADGRHRASSAVLLDICGIPVSPIHREVEGDNWLAEAVWACEKNREVTQTGAEQRLASAVVLYRTRDKSEWSEAEFSRALKVKRGVGQTTFGQVRLVVDSGVPFGDAVKLNAAQCREVLKEAREDRPAKVSAILKDKSDKSNPEPLKAKVIKEIAQDANKVLRAILDTIVTGDKDALTRLAGLSSGEFADYIIAQEATFAAEAKAAQEAAESATDDE